MKGKSCSISHAAVVYMQGLPQSVGGNKIYTKTFNTKPLVYILNFFMVSEQ